jgi:TolB-like protein
MTKVLGTTLVAAGAALILLASVASAAPEAPPESRSVAKSVEIAPHPMPLTVAVLPFDSKDKALGAQTAEVIAARLSSDPALQLVERDRLDAILDEHKLSLSAAVQPAEAARIGWLAGAKVLVVGRAYALDDTMLITARTVGVETGRVYVTQVRGSLNLPLLSVLDKLAETVHKDVTTRRAQLVAPDISADKEALLKRLAERLKGKSLPKIAVAIMEMHYGEQAPDPAAETELMLWLKECGFTVFDPGRMERNVRDWARDYFRSAEEAIPRTMPEDVKIILIGQAFSEAAGRFGDLISAKGRVEVRALDRETGAIIAIARRTQATVDLSQQIAGKKAIEEAAANIAYELIPKIAAK